MRKVRVQPSGPTFDAWPLPSWSLNATQLPAPNQCSCSLDGSPTYTKNPPSVVTEGGFFVYVGEPSKLQEHWFGAGSWVAFNDHEGSGHASKVGPDGCTRTFRMLRGRLSNDG